MQSHDPTKRIPKSLGTAPTLVGTYTLTDLAVGLFPAVLVVLTMQLLVPPSLEVAGLHPQTLTLPVAAVAIGVGAIFVAITPTYTTSLEWIETVLRFYRRPRDLPHEDAKEVTKLARVHPEHDALERTDGTVLGLVRVDPPTMALATDAEWATMAESFRDFCNTVVEFPVQLYSTTQPFPVERYLSHYRGRLEDPDVRDNPQLAALIENYIDWYASVLEDRRMTIRDHYIVVPVGPDEVQFSRESLSAKLTRIPLLGVFIGLWVGKSAHDQQAALFETLDDRVRRVEAGVRAMEGCHASRIDATAATQVLAEYWSGEDREYADLESVLRTRPLIGGNR